MNSRCDPVEALDATAIQALLAVLERHFSGVTAATFAADLAAKTHVIRLFDDGGSVVGFSTLAYQRRVWRGADLAVVSSGDTIVDPLGWSAARLAPAWIAAVRRLHGEASTRLVWLLICSGIRTYRFLPVFWRHFVPAPGVTDEDLLALRDDLARERYGRRFCSRSGIVRLAEAQVLRPHLATAPVHLAADAHARFFMERNPGHAAGDELACLCDLRTSNLTAAGRRAAGLLAEPTAEPTADHELSR